MNQDFWTYFVKWEYFTSFPVCIIRPTDLLAVRVPLNKVSPEVLIHKVLYLSFNVFSNLPLLYTCAMKMRCINLEWSGCVI